MSRLEWLLSGILAVLLVVVLALLIRFGLERYQAPDVDEVGATEQPVVEAKTAMASYEVARPAAQAWAADAELLNARASWPEGATFDPERGGWSFVFYSPSQEETALFSVSQNGAQLISNRQIERTLNLYPTTGWQIDSPQLLSIVMESGGRDFLEQYQLGNLTLTLDTNDHFIWRARLINTEAPASLTLQVDPAAGRVISREQSP